MAGIGNFNINRKKKGNKLLIAAAVIVILFFAVVCYIGIVAGSHGEAMQEISSAVAENTQLKQQINEQNGEIAKLREEVASLNAQLEARPTAPPVSSPIPVMTPPTQGEQTNVISPRSQTRR